MLAKGNFTPWRQGVGVSLLSWSSASFARDRRCRRFQHPPMRLFLLDVSELHLWVLWRGALPRSLRPSQLRAGTSDMSMQRGEGHTPLKPDNHRLHPQTNLGWRKHESYPWQELSRHRESARCPRHPGLPSRLRPGLYPSWQRGSLRPPSAADRISA